MDDTTTTYRPDMADDLEDTALAAIEGRKDILALIATARIAAGALETRGMRATGMRIRELCDRITRTMH